MDDDSRGAVRFAMPARLTVPMNGSGWRQIEIVPMPDAREALAKRLTALGGPLDLVRLASRLRARLFAPSPRTAGRPGAPRAIRSE